MQGNNSNKIQPFLRWAGSKRKLLPKLTEYWNDSYDRYIEPFMGSACLYFALQPQKAILADINAELVNTYLVVKENPKKLFNTLDEMPVNKKAYYKLRSERYRQSYTIKRAARFIYLNRYCFNGLYRTNRKGEFNVPFSNLSTGNLPTYEHLLNLSQQLKSTEILSSDFESILRKVKKNDFVYLDPPYAIKNRKIFTQYGPDSFGLDDIKRLALALDDIDRIGATFVVSYAYCTEAIEAFKNWNSKKIFVQRNIAGFNKNRKKSAELIITNLDN